MVVRLLLLSLLLLLCPQVGSASLEWSFGFANVSERSDENAAIGEAQLRLEVEELPGRYVMLTLRNVGPEACELMELQLEESPLADEPAIVDTPEGARFRPQSPPRPLPATDRVGFEAHVALKALQARGLGPGQEMRLAFELRPGRSYRDVVAALRAGELRAAVVLDGFAHGGAESFVLEPEPLPGGARLP